MKIKIKHPSKYKREKTEHLATRLLFSLCFDNLTLNGSIMHITAIKGTTFQLHISGVFTDDTGTDVLTKNLPEGGLSIFGYDTSILSIGSPVPDEFGFMVPVTVVADSGKTEITASVGPITGTMTFSVKEVVPPVIVATKLILTATGDVEVI